MLAVKGPHFEKHWDKLVLCPSVVVQKPGVDQPKPSFPWRWLLASVGPADLVPGRSGEGLLQCTVTREAPCPPPPGQWSKRGAQAAPRKHL